MKVTFNKNELMNAIIPAMGTVSNKNTLAAVEGILIDTCDNGSCTLSSFDLDKGMRTSVSAEVDEPGSYIINAGKLNQIVRLMPDGDITIEVDKRNLTKITGGRSSFELHALSGEDFPNLPELNLEKGIRIRQCDLKRMIAGTFFAIAQNDPRPALNGALLRITENKIAMVSCDGNRLAVKEFECEIDLENYGDEKPDIQVIVPGKSLAELMKLIGDTEDMVTIRPARKHIVFQVSGFLFFTRIIDEKYMDYERFIPKTSKIFVTLSRPELIAALERASLVTEDRTMGQTKSVLVCEFTDGWLKITSTSVTSSVYDEIPAAKEGEDLRIGFNCRYLLDALRACDTDRLKLSLTTSLMSMIIQPAPDFSDHETEKEETGNYLYLVNPIKMKE